MRDPELPYFSHSYVPHTFDLGAAALREMNQLEIVFRDLPRFNGMPFVSSQIRDPKARFNYAWDWMPRNVQIGIWDDIWLEIDETPVLESLSIKTDFDLVSCTGLLYLQGTCDEALSLHAMLDTTKLGTYRNKDLAAGLKLSGLAVEPWQCNGLGEARLYRLSLELRDA